MENMFLYTLYITNIVEVGQNTHSDFDIIGQKIGQTEKVLSNFFFLCIRLRQPINYYFFIFKNKDIILKMYI